MNNFNAAFLKYVLLGFVGSLITFAVVAHVADWLHPRLPCMPWESKIFAERPGFLDHDKVSSYFWSSLCTPDTPPVLITASEGTLYPTFTDLLAEKGIAANEFKGAHRGLKTFGYMLGNKIHPDRLQRLRLVALVNPVYFSFAAKTDATSMRLSSISSPAYLARVPTGRHKWDEFFFDSLYIGGKSYVSEIKKYFLPPEFSAPLNKDVIVEPSDEEYDFDRNMFIEMTKNFTTYRSRFSSREEPSHKLLMTVKKFIDANPEAKICVVLLPFNAKDFASFGRDAVALEADLENAFAQIAPGHILSLQKLNYTPKIFADPMHFTPYGKLTILNQVLADPCANSVLVKHD